MSTVVLKDGRMRLIENREDIGRLIREELGDEVFFEFITQLDPVVSNAEIREQVREEIEDDFRDDAMDDAIDELKFEVRTSMSDILKKMIPGISDEKCEDVTSELLERMGWW